jgi:hypothetical protein
MRKGQHSHILLVCVSLACWELVLWRVIRQQQSLACAKLPCQKQQWHCIWDALGRQPPGLTAQSSRGADSTIQRCTRTEHINAYPACSSHYVLPTAMNIHKLPQRYEAHKMQSASHSLTTSLRLCVTAVHGWCDLPKLFSLSSQALTNLLVLPAWQA